MYKNNIGMDLKGIGKRGFDLSSPGQGGMKHCTQHEKIL
jgi:hypothetical protein